VTVRNVLFIQLGVIILADNQPGAHYFYLVTVITGWARGSGTTSSVTMYMSGTEGTSDRHVLEDTGGGVHDAGNENWFLIATPESLGNLRKVRVWHSSSGICPAWYVIRRNICVNKPVPCTTFKTNGRNKV